MFDDRQWDLLPEVERTRILNERAAYKRRRFGDNDNASTISQLTGTVNQGDIQSITQTMANLQQQISSLTSSQSGNDNSNTNDGPPRSIMGGCNEQQNLWSRNNH